jgi:hypothetical protein
LNLEKARNSSLNSQADHPAFVFQVVGQSRDDVLTAVRKAGGHHPGSQFAVENNSSVDNTSCRYPLG